MKDNSSGGPPKYLLWGTIGCFGLSCLLVTAAAVALFALFRFRYDDGNAFDVFGLKPPDAQLVEIYPGNGGAEGPRSYYYTLPYDLNAIVAHYDTYFEPHGVEPSVWQSEARFDSDERCAFIYM